MVDPIVKKFYICHVLLLLTFSWNDEHEKSLIEFFLQSKENQVAEMSSSFLFSPTKLDISEMMSHSKVVPP